MLQKLHRNVFQVSLQNIQRIILKNKYNNKKNLMDEKNNFFNMYLHKF
jgi:hypothetical protein